MENKTQTMMKQIVEQDLKPIIIRLFERMKKEGLALELDGVPAYNPEAQFVGGTVINTSCFIVLELIKTEESLKDLGNIIRMAAKMEMQTWGILGSINGLYRLQTRGLLEKVVDEETLNILKQSLDWRTFVNAEDHYALINKPTNYYGVAFRIARYRELLGWEQEEHSTYLLKHLLEHIDQYSGELLYMDETQGDGRFDRYSIAIPGELAAAFLDTGCDVPEKIRAMLKKSVRIVLQLANEEGVGISYGRSIDVYGDTTVLEIFSATVRLGDILTEEELEIAYGYSMKVMKRVIDFWYDKDMESINIWEHGRKTDNYRDKNRILGVNLDIFLNLMGAYESWKKAGFGNHEICSDFNKKLDKLDAYTYIPFAEGEYKRGLAIIRDGRQIWSLPLINGGQFYYDRDAYMPVPFQDHVLQGVPECNHGQLVPQLIMENGEVYMPLSYITGIVSEIANEHMSIICEYGNLCRLGSGIFVSDESQTFGTLGHPEKVEGINATVRYTFEKNHIHRKDIFAITSNEKVKEVRVVLLTYSEDPEVEENKVMFKKGTVVCMCTEGYDTCSIKPAVDDGSYDTPQGRLNYAVIWSRKVVQACEKLEVGWTIEYTDKR